MLTQKPQASASQNPPVLFRQKLLLIVFGLFLSLLLIEGMLRIGGWLFLTKMEMGNRQSIAKGGEYRILCLGESTTALGKEDSYPRQLEKILKQTYPGMKVSVINAGIPSVTTSGILSTLSKKLNNYQPNMVTVMMGINDMIYGETVHYKDDDNIFNRIAIFIGRLRVSKLFSLLKRSLLAQAEKFFKIPPKDKNQATIGYFGGQCKTFAETVKRKGRDVDDIKRGLWLESRGKIPEALSMFQKAIAENPSFEWPYLEIGLMYHYSDNAKAESAYRKAIELNPNNDEAYHRLGHLYWAGSDVAEEMYLKALEIDPKRICTYMELATHYQKMQDYKKTEMVYRRAIDAVPADDWAYRGLATLYQIQGKTSLAEEYRILAEQLRSKIPAGIIERNYLQLRDVLRERGIDLVVVGYPMRDINPLKSLFKSDKKVLFVDNKKIFEAAVGKERYSEYFIDRFAGDFGHCTAQGNRLIAQNIAAAVSAHLEKNTKKQSKKLTSP